MEPLFQLGKGGMSDALIKQVDDALTARELIKVKVLRDTSPLTPREAADRIAEATGSEVVAVIGGSTELCRRTFTGKNYEVSTMEIDRDTDSYMIFTVNEILSKYKDAQLFLIIGSDMFLSFHKWYKYREIMKKCTLCVMSREDEDTVKALRSYAFSTLHIYMPSNEANGIIISPSSPLEISSTEIRQKISAGEDVSDVLTKEAYEFIKERGMYGYAKK